MQHILGLVRRCVEDYHMVDPGETVAVGVSGGKDSLLTLAALAQLRRFYPVPFNVHAITLETGTHVVLAIVPLVSVKVAVPSATLYAFPSVSEVNSLPVSAKV